MIQKTRQPLQLGKIIDQLDANESKKAIAIAGKVNNRKTRTLNAIYEYKSKKQVLTKAENKNLQNITYSQPTSISPPKIVGDIARSLKTNLKPENYITKKATPKFLKKTIAKRKARKINRIFDNLNAVTSNQYIATRTQGLFPILTTISTLGTSLGVPLLSIALIRIKEIEQFAGSGGFTGFVSFCLIIILIGICALFFYLFTTIKYNRLQRISISVDEVFSKIIKNYFLLPNDNDNKKHHFKRLGKFKITSSENIFYNEIDIKDKHYEDLLKLISILVKLNNNVIFTVNINYDHEIKQIYNPNIFSNNFIVMDVSNFKTPTNYRLLLDFLLNELTSIFKFNCQQLFFRNKNFAKIINAFLDEATTNFQLIQLINLSQSYIGCIGDKLAKEKYLTFFLDFFTMLALKAISDQNYLYFVNELQISYSVNEKLYGNIYTNLQVRKLVSDNWKRYKTNSILFSLDQIFENKSWFSDSLENLDASVQIQEINLFDQVKQYLKRQGFNKTDETLENSEIYVNEMCDKILLYNVPDNCDNLFDFTDEKFKLATVNGISYICFLFRFIRVFMKYNESRFEIMPETVI